MELSHAAYLGHLGWPYAVLGRDRSLDLATVAVVDFKRNALSFRES